MCILNELQVLNLYNDASGKSVDEFIDNVKSSLNVKIDYDKTEFDDEWITIMEETVRYIDNILRNPNRFIVNEEDIVKVELARRVTVESIKHLSRNTNLIQDIDKKTGDVKPSKILNINKEESYNTYENRFVFSLIENMKSYIALKEKSIAADYSSKDNKFMEYSATSKIGGEKVNISLSLDSKLDEDGSSSSESGGGNNILERISKLKEKVTDLTGSEVYKTLKKLHVALVTSPIKKTNVILKNTNFQYALKLWDYMQNHMTDNTKRVKDSKSEKIEGRVRNYADEAFLLNYLVLDTFSHETKDKAEKREVSEKIVGTMLQKLMDLNGYSQDELKDIIEKQYTIIKYRNVVNDKEIHKKFKVAINKYMNHVDSIKLE